MQGPKPETRAQKKFVQVKNFQRIRRTLGGNVPDRRSSYKLKTFRETRVPKAVALWTEEALSSSRRLGNQEYLRRKRPGQMELIQVQDV